MRKTETVVTVILAILAVTMMTTLLVVFFNNFHTHEDTTTTTTTATTEEVVTPSKEENLTTRVKVLERRVQKMETFLAACFIAAVGFAAFAIYEIQYLINAIDEGGD